jgi:seryl-tRNA synthetase
MIEILVMLAFSTVLFAFDGWMSRRDLRLADEAWDEAADQWLAWEGRTESANKRRKRVEKYLTRARRKNVDLAAANAELRDRLKKADQRAWALAADLAELLLKQEDNASVREGLLRKLR